MKPSVSSLTRNRIVETKTVKPKKKKNSLQPISYAGKAFLAKMFMANKLGAKISDSFQ